MEADFKGKFNNNILHTCGREPTEPVIIQRADGTVIANMDGWAMIPVEEYHRLKLSDPQ